MTTTHDVGDAARHLHDAEIALHDARQSHCDQWVVAAADRLHEAVVEYLTALAEESAPERPERIMTVTRVDWPDTRSASSARQTIPMRARPGCSGATRGSPDSLRGSRASSTSRTACSA